MVTTRPPKTIVKPTALGPVANTDTKLLIYGLFQKGRVLAQDGILDQLNTSSFDFIAEEGDNSPVHTIVLGQGASRYASAEELQEQIQDLLRIHPPTAAPFVFKRHWQFSVRIPI